MPVKHTKGNVHEHDKKMVKITQKISKLDKNVDKGNSAILI